MKINVKEIREKMISERTGKPMTQMEFANAVGVQLSTVSHWETGKRTPGALSTAAILRAWEEWKKEKEENK